MIVKHFVIKKTDIKVCKKTKKKCNNNIVPDALDRAALFTCQSHYQNGLALKINLQYFSDAYI